MEERNRFMSNYLNNLPQWVTWVFSGVGVTLTVLVLKFLFSKKTGRTHNQVQKAGDNSTQAMAGRDLKPK
jgi:hypothetical protein